MAGGGGSCTVTNELMMWMLTNKSYHIQIISQ